MLNCKGVLAPTVGLTVCARLIHGRFLSISFLLWLERKLRLRVERKMATACPCKCKREGAREERLGEDGATRACMGGCVHARTTMHEVVSSYVS
jgi:hypothetical protein